MEKSEKNTPSSSAGSSSSARTEPGLQSGNRPGANDWQIPGNGMPAVARTQRWVKKNPLPALIGAFAFGAFIGAFMRG